MTGPVRHGELACVFLVALLAALVIQWRCGAWQREFGFHPDESAHYVTGVMVSEYLRAGAQEHPLRFAEQYYVRYPRLALGHWPPLFSAVLGSWILVFGTEKLTIFLLLALLAASAALALYLLARLEGSIWLAAAAVVCWLLLQRQTQAWVSSVMTEIPLALCCLAALLAYVRYLRTERWDAAVLFGLAASAALLTKGLGVALAFVPPVAAWAAGRTALLGRWSFWAPAGIVLALAGPWYALQGSLIPTAFGGALERLSIARLAGLDERVGFLLQSFGPAAGVLVVLALAAAFFAGSVRRRCSALTAVLLAYAGGGLLLHFVLPESAEPRHLFHVIPAILALAVVGLHGVSTKLPPWMARAAGVVVIAMGAGRLAWPHGWPVKPDFALVALAEEIAADPTLDGTVLLVAANGASEGALIAELARLSPDPRWFVLRSSKTLAWVNWAAQDEYVPLYDNPSDIAAYLQSIPVAAVIVAVGQYKTLPHDELLLEALESAPERWRQGDLRLSSSHPYEVREYLSTRPELRPQDPIRIDLSRRLGRVVEASPSPSLRHR